MNHRRKLAIVRLYKNDLIDLEDTLNNILVRDYSELTILERFGKDNIYPMLKAGRVGELPSKAGYLFFHYKSKPTDAKDRSLHLHFSKQFAFIEATCAQNDEIWARGVVDKLANFFCERKPLCIFPYTKRELVAVSFVFFPILLIFFAAQILFYKYLTPELFANFSGVIDYVSSTAAIWHIFFILCASWIVAFCIFEGSSFPVTKIYPREDRHSKRNFVERVVPQLVERFLLPICATVIGGIILFMLTR